MNVEELKKQLESGELVGEDLSDTVLDGGGFHFLQAKTR